MSVNGGTPMPLLCPSFGGLGGAVCLSSDGHRMDFCPAGFAEHAVLQEQTRWAHLGSNQGDARTALSSVGRQTRRFPGGTPEANPGDRTHSRAGSDPAGGHTMDKRAGWEPTARETASTFLTVSAFGARCVNTAERVPNESREQRYSAKPASRPALHQVAVSCAEKVGRVYHTVSRANTHAFLRLVRPRRRAVMPR